MIRQQTHIKRLLHVLMVSLYDQNFANTLFVDEKAIPHTNYTAFIRSHGLL